MELLDYETNTGGTVEGPHPSSNEESELYDPKPKSEKNVARG